MIAMNDSAKKFGEVKIADDVVSSIAGLAAAEVEGVASLAGNITSELAGKFGAKNLSKGVKIAMIDHEVMADLNIVMKYGFSIPKTSAAIQERVKAAIENMTGLLVSEINIRVVGVEMHSS